jgi:hypothetical protein
LGFQAGDGVNLVADNPIALEGGMQYLASAGWQPPRCDPAYVASCIAQGDTAACAGRLVDGALVSTNYVERIAIAWSLLRLNQGGPHAAAPMWEALELIGAEVSPDFAESGATAYRFLQIAAALNAGQMEPLVLAEAYQALGQLWAAAFRAPSGYATYIARSASGQLPPAANFFAAAPPASPTPQQLGAYLCRLVDLLQTAIAINTLPEGTVGERFGGGGWEAFSTRIAIRVGINREKKLELHCKREVLSPQATRVHVQVYDREFKQTLGVGRAVVLQGKSGMYDEFIELASSVGGTVSEVVNDVFAPQEVVTIFPRVRLLLDSAENRVHHLVVIEGASVDRRWRQREIGMLLMRQLLLEIDDVDLVLGRPGAYPATGAPVTFGVVAGYAAARLKLARYWERMGAEFLINGVMGMPRDVVRRQQTFADAERTD